MSMFTDVLAFHKKFGQTIGRDKSVPHSVDDRLTSFVSGDETHTPLQAEHRLIEFRISLIEEELMELKDALVAGDRAEVADALCDLIYVVIGTGIAFAMDLRPVWKEVQRSNMMKEGGAKREDGKLLKPEGWKKPDIVAALEAGEDLNTLNTEFDDED